MYVLKEIPEDFIVVEELEDGFVSTQGGILIFLLHKRRYTTQRAISQLAKSLGIPQKWIGYAGSKDKQAMTAQHITLKNVSRQRVQALTLKDISLEFVGFSSRALDLGDLKGNHFDIVVRHIDEIKRFEQVPEEFFIPNYFDEQRFSTHNVEIGKAILRKDFDDAVAAIMRNDEDHRVLLQQHLLAHKNDYVGALRRIPAHTLLLYVHAVQSLLFNELLAQQLRNQDENATSVDYSQGEFVFAKQPVKESLTLPLVGYLSELDEKAQELLEEHDLQQDMFVIRQFPGLSLEGSMRPAFVKVSSLSLSKLEEDELHKGNKKMKLSFSLPKGAYATIVVRHLFATVPTNQ